ncbi:hypothetical protein EMIT07CA2_120007 [Brevibacillus sp. IT-7CA2]
MRQTPQKKIRRTSSYSFLREKAPLEREELPGKAFSSVQRFALEQPTNLAR